MFGRVARRIIRVGLQGLLVETFMARTARGQAPRRLRFASLASDHTVGSVGILPSSTPLSGRTRCCPAVRPLAERTWERTSVSTLGLCLHTQLRTQCLRICSVCCSWRGGTCHCRSQRLFATGASNLWSRTDDTELRAHDPAEFGSGLLPQSACWRESVAKLVPESSATRS